MASSELKASGSARAIFVVGTSRSGKTVLSQILNRSPKVFAFVELHFFERLWLPASSDRVEKNSQNLDVDRAARLYAQLLQTQRRSILKVPRELEYLEEAREVVDEQGLVGRSPLEVYRFFLSIYANLQKPGAMPCEQTPTNVFYIRELLSGFPDIRIINIIRDPRDVLISKKEKWRSARKRGDKNIPFKEIVRQSINNHPYIVAKLWSAAVRAADLHRDCPWVRSIRFEDLVTDPELQVKKLCEFVGIEYSNDMLNIVEDVEIKRRASGIQRGVNPGKAFLWKNLWQKNDKTIRLTELYICQRVALKEIQEHGYAAPRMTANPIALIWYALCLPLNVLIGLFVNKGRVKSLQNAISRRLILSKS